jgi:hypothetical protein
MSCLVLYIQFIGAGQRDERYACPVMVAAFPAPSENAVLVASYALFEPDESGLNPLGRLDPHSDDTEIHDADDVVGPLMAAACHTAQGTGTLRPAAVPGDSPVFFVFLGHYSILLTTQGTAMMAMLFNILYQKCHGSEENSSLFIKPRRKTPSFMVGI